MQAIQTAYKGYKFRSRLEARWAVFLDTLGAQWTYEAEGYDLDGVWYLPDFLVTEWNCWIEIKGKNPSAEESEKCARLATASGKDVLLICGEPWAEDAKNHYEITLFTPGSTASSSGWEFGEGRRCAEELWLVNGDSAHTLMAVPHERDDKFPLGGTWAPSIMAALKAARQARFEHGETP